MNVTYGKISSSWLTQEYHPVLPWKIGGIWNDDPCDIIGK